MRVLEFPCSGGGSVGRDRAHEWAAKVKDGVEDVSSGD